MLNPVHAWFDWLQRGAPAAPVERYPALSDTGETSLPGVYVVGDLTGIPLLKLAAEGGHDLVMSLRDDRDFERRRRTRPQGAVDLLIVGAGPAGVSAALTAQKQGLTFDIVESATPFATIEDFPKGKPIFAEPADRVARGPLSIRTGVKESLVEDLRQAVADGDLDITTGVRIETLRREGPVVVAVDSEGLERRALAVALAIGKSGDARTLDVPGADLPHVGTRLFDPATHADEDLVVVGGGDSALEAVIALAQAGARVTLSYRKGELTRPKEGNLSSLRALSDQGRVTLRLGTTVEAIDETSVTLTGDGGEARAKASTVYLLIGRDMPLAFLRRSGVRMEGELSGTSKLLFLLSILFANVVYFGKSMPADWLQRGPGAWDWKNNLMGAVGWGSFALIPPVVAWTAWAMVRNRSAWRGSPWRRFKWAYFACAFGFFCAVFFGSRYAGLELLGRPPAFWYGLLYCVTMTVFGLRRAHVRPTPYIRAQTATLVAIQWIFLWLLPEIVIPWAGQAGHLGPADGFLRTEVFPGDQWWRAYGFILAWPLFIWNLYTSEPTTFWLVASVVQTAVLIPLGIRFFGKGVYCGWICSCGGLAETLGDEYRTLAPHGPGPKRWENAGQVVLAVALVMTALKLAGVGVADAINAMYYVVVDIVFAGVLGVGVYFFMSGRVWCRFLCPLAALMHIYTKFTKYRIFSRKKRCISCNVCTKSCHMGIDVMSYAVRGVPMDDVECVRCSACVVNCPMDVLAFGRIGADGQPIGPKLHATRFDPVDWTDAVSQGHVGVSETATSPDAFVHDPVKKVRGAAGP